MIYEIYVIIFHLSYITLINYNFNTLLIFRLNIVEASKGIKNIGKTI